MPKSRTIAQQGGDGQVIDVQPKSETDAGSAKSTSTAKRKADTSANDLASEGERAWIRRKLEDLGVELQAACEEAGISNFDALTSDGFIALKDLINRLERQ